MLRESQQKLSEIEQRVNAFREGKPDPQSVKAFIEEQLAESPNLREYIEREHNEFKAALQPITNSLLEQNIGLDNFSSELSSLRGDVKELKDNFNLYTSRMLKINEDRLAIVKDATASLKLKLETL